jgi:tetratricopeptide (TPR) repeat protein
VASGSADGTALVLIYRPDDLIAEACSRVTRNLTLAEWKQYIGDALPYQAVCSNLLVDLEYIKAIAVDALSNTDDPNRVKTALDKVQAVLIQEAGLVPDPVTESFSIVSTAVSSFAQKISSRPTAGEIKRTLDLLEQARQMKLTIDDQLPLTELCWFGSINGYAKQALQYCEAAVKLAPDSAGIRDSRGLARALTGDYQGAILDFQYFVDQYGNNDLVDQRKLWIDQLKKGINPFTPDILESLKQQ